MRRERIREYVDHVIREDGSEAICDFIAVLRRKAEDLSDTPGLHRDERNAWERLYSGLSNVHRAECTGTPMHGLRRRRGRRR